MIKHVIKWILISSTFCLPISLCFADQQPQSIGQVVWVKGTVKAISQNQTARVLQRRSPIYVADTISTDATSTGEIVFSDNSLMSLRADTSFKVDEYSFGKNIPPSKAKYVATLVKGGFRTITGLIPKENSQNYKINTPVATIGTQGTDYAIFYNGGQLHVARFHGGPCITGSDKKRLCLNESTGYAAVGTNGIPVVSAHTPSGIFDEQPSVTVTTYTAAGPTDNNAAAGGTTGGGPGGSSGNPPGGGSKSVSSFCIQ